MKREIPMRAAQAAGREAAQTKSDTVPREPGKGPAPAQPSCWQVTRICAATDCLGRIVSYRDLGGISPWDGSWCLAIAIGVIPSCIVLLFVAKPAA